MRHLRVKAVTNTPQGQATIPGPVPEILKPNTVRNFFIALFTFFLINVTWVFFRATNFHDAWAILRSMFGVQKGGEAMLATLAIVKVGVIVVLMVIVHWCMRNTRVLDVIAKLPWWLVGICWSFLLLMLIWSQESSSSFIYFQF